MPISVYRLLDLRDLKPTGVVIHLANRSVVMPLGFIEDLLVQVKDLMFPVDFFILDMENESSNHGSTLILGRPFFMIVKTKIDVHAGTFSMEFEISIAIHFDFNVGTGSDPPSPLSSTINLPLPSTIQPPSLELKPLHEHLKPVRQPQRRLNPTILDVVKKDEMKLLAARIIYPISYSTSVSPFQVVPKKSGITVVRNQDNELIPTRVANSWRVYIDYRRQNQIRIAPEDYKRPYSHIHSAHLPTPGCLLAYVMVLALSKGACLSRFLDRCIETNLVLNFERCHFMVHQGIVLGHLVSSRGIEVDKAKIDAITSHPYPASMWEVHSFLGHVGFYRRFIQDFSKIALPLSKHLQKDVDFVLDQPCREAFEELRRRLTSSPIMQPPNWELPFELMCDASNYALGLVLSQRADRLSYVIDYASRTLDLT
eukprot:XP_006606981.1 uncharacterized protein LOC102663453 [Glycine max]